MKQSPSQTCPYVRFFTYITLLYVNIHHRHRERDGELQKTNNGGVIFMALFRSSPSYSSIPPSNAALALAFPLLLLLPAEGTASVVRTWMASA